MTYHVLIIGMHTIDRILQLMFHLSLTFLLFLQLFDIFYFILFHIEVILLKFLKIKGFFADINIIIRF